MGDHADDIGVQCYPRRTSTGKPACADAIPRRRVWRPSDAYDLQEFGQADEVVHVAGIQREAGGHGRRGDHQVRESSPSCLAPGRVDRGEHTPVGPGHVGIDRQRVEGSFGALQAVLPARTFRRVGRCVGTRGPVPRA